MDTAVIVLCLQLFHLSQLNPAGPRCENPHMYLVRSGECFHPASQGPCEDGEWLVVKNSGMLECERNPCEHPDQVEFSGRCHNIHEDGVCGETALGQRLFVNERGEGVCGCDDGWAADEQRICYQEFTPGFCKDNQIIRIRKPSIPKHIIYEEDFAELKIRLSKSLMNCEDNPCGDPTVSLPHV